MLGYFTQTEHLIKTMNINGHDHNINKQQINHMAINVLGTIWNNTQGLILNKFISKCCKTQYKNGLVVKMLA